MPFAGSGSDELNGLIGEAGGLLNESEFFRDSCGAVQRVCSLISLAEVAVFLSELAIAAHGLAERIRHDSAVCLIELDRRVESRGKMSVGRVQGLLILVDETRPGALRDEALIESSRLFFVRENNLVQRIPFLVERLGLRVFDLLARG